MKDYTKDEIEVIKKKNKTKSSIITYVMYFLLIVILIFFTNAFAKSVTHNNDTIELIKSRGYIIKDNGMFSVAKKNDIVVCNKKVNEINENDIVVFQNENNNYQVAKITEIRTKQDGTYKYIGKRDLNDEEIVISIEKIKGKYSTKIIKIGGIYNSHPALLGLYMFIVVSLILGINNNKAKKEERAFSRHEIRMRYEVEKKIEKEKNIK